MPQMDFFPQRPEVHPMIYAYRDLNPDYDGLLKVGYTEKDVDRRVAQQYPTKRPDGKLPYEILYRSSAMREDGSCFTDHDVHRMLRRRKITGVGGEWFRCTLDELEAAVLAVKTDTINEENRTRTFSMRPEQEEAVNKTIAYFRSAKLDTPDRAPKFLWNAKMRFGKTFAAYELAKRMGLKKVLVLTFKPAVEAAWEEDLMTHKDFEGWQFICRDGMRYEDADLSRPIVCFGSFQDYLGTNESGGIKAKNEWVHTTNWDIVIFDEYHFGAWRDNAKSSLKWTTRMRITTSIYPAIVLWENVLGAMQQNLKHDYLAVLRSFAGAEVPMPASGRWADAGMVRGRRCDLAWRVMDAQYWAQPRLARRERVFVVADFTGQRAAEILFKPRPMLQNFELCSAGGLPAAEDHREASLDAGRKIPVILPFYGFKMRGAAANGNRGEFLRSFGKRTDVFPTLLASDQTAFAYYDEDAPEDGCIRYPTEAECERLMGLPTDWTRYGADGAEIRSASRYFALGNSVALPCAEYIMAGIAETLQK